MYYINIFIINGNIEDPVTDFVITAMDCLNRGGTVDGEFQLGAGP